MTFIVFVLLVINGGQEITATRASNVIRNSGGTEAATRRADEATAKHLSWINLRGEENPLGTDELRKPADTKADTSNRRSKILRTLAFITGLSVGDLAGAASADVKAYAKFPPLGVNVEASRISPHIAPIYDPYPYVSHSYILATPLRFYPIWDRPRLQSANGVPPNNYQPLPHQNLETTNPLDNNKQTGSLSDDAEYVDEAKKVENVKAAGNADGNNKKGTEFQVEENDRNAEEKVISFNAACKMQKEINPKRSGSLSSISGDRDNADSSLTMLNPRAANTTNLTVSANTTLNNATQIPATMVSNGTTTATQNSTIDNNTSVPPPFGYYGGYPQNIHHIELTTETYDQKYHNYDHINYNLPAYDKPVNFYSDDRYNFYPVPPVDAYPSSQYHQDQVPEYFSNDFKRHIYAPDNTPAFINSDFRPVV